MRFIYIVIAYLISPIVIGALAVRGFRERSQWQGFSGRFGFGRAIVPAAGQAPETTRLAQLDVVRVATLREAVAAALTGHPDADQAGSEVVGQPVMEGRR